MKYARLIAFFILIGATLYFGLPQFLSEETGVSNYWEGKLGTLSLVFLLGAVDVILEGVGWAWVYARFHIRVWDVGGFFAYLSNRAGLLLPVQLGRLIRPDAMVRLRRGTLPDCLKAEAVVFMLDGTSVLALLAGLGAFIFLHPLLAPLASLGTIVFLLLLGNVAARLLSGTKLALPATFWWRWQTFAIIFIEMLGWAIHGFALYILLRGLAPEISMVEPMFSAAAASILGAGTGLPGGIGATEILLGGSIKIMIYEIKKETLFSAVAAFRLVTFWVWIPVGWAALAVVKQRVARLNRESPLPEENGETGENAVPEPTGAGLQAQEP